MRPPQQLRKLFRGYLIGFLGDGREEKRLPCKFCTESLNRIKLTPGIAQGHCLCPLFLPCLCLSQEESPPLWIHCPWCCQELLQPQSHPSTAARASPTGSILHPRTQKHTSQVRRCLGLSGLKAEIPSTTTSNGRTIKWIEETKVNGLRWRRVDLGEILGRNSPL